MGRTGPGQQGISVCARLIATTPRERGGERGKRGGERDSKRGRDGSSGGECGKRGKRGERQGTPAGSHPGAALTGPRSAP